MMRRRRFPILLWLIVLFMAAGTIYQTVDWYRAKTDKPEAERYLYQICLFQMQALASALQQPPEGAPEMESLKRLVYIARFSHEKLVLTYGEDRVDTLDSLQELLSYLMGAQISGVPESESGFAGDTNKWREMATLYKEISEHYAKLITTGGEVVTTQNDALAKLDREAMKLLQNE
ncbi:hypothetical protein [Gorillibacterium massiliense]|uniref:hypothetical protein n=1 Tax=Gorillibacterium massiliense TaxID=1280390 RepID=UPI0004B31DAB|nr:hypothetical protein [Gorillibacterium massiliense]